MANCSAPWSCGIQCEENVAALVGERSGSPYFSPEPEITILSYVAGLKLDGRCKASIPHTLGFHTWCEVVEAFH
jgi:hypothetical protein